MISLAIMVIMGIAVVALYFDFPIIYGFCFGVVLTYLFTMERMFRQYVGREPDYDDSNKMFKHLFKR